MARIPDEIIDRIQTANDIVEVISGYFPLKRSGRNFKALCPFHTEKTPSFVVSPDKQIYHCFGCGEGGNVFGFLMKVENIGFIEAVKMLAERARIEVRFEGGGREDDKGELYRINGLVARSYHKVLLSPERGARALSYLTSRGITEETIVTFGLGFAPPGWDNVVKWAARKKIPRKHLLGLGLVIPGEKGDHDRFRDRIIFPIRSVAGKVAGFSGRVIGSGAPKYVNSPESRIFSKGRILYGLDIAKSEIVSSKFAVVCEGQLDCIMLHQAGLKNTVATQGTALTERHARLLKRYCSDIVMAFDADEAGKKASLRGLDVMLAAGLRVKIAVFPPGVDPDGYVREHGGRKTRELVEAAPTLLDFLLETLLGEFDVNTERGKVEISRQMLGAIAKLESSVLRESYLKKLSRRLGVSLPALEEDMGRLPADRPRRAGRPRKAVTAQPPPVEKYLIREMLASGETLSLVGKHLGPGDFVHPTCREVVEIALSRGRGEDPGQMMNRSEDPEVRKLIAASIADLEEREEEGARGVEDAIKKVKRLSIERKVEKLKEQLASPGIDPLEVARIQMEINRLALEKSGLGMV